MLKAYKLFYRGKPFPRRYKQPFFYLVALLLVLSGGLLALAQDATTPALALNIGLTAPLILQSLARTEPKK